MQGDSHCREKQKLQWTMMQTQLEPLQYSTIAFTDLDWSEI